MICARRFTSVGNAASGASNGWFGSKTPTSIPRAAAAGLAFAPAATTHMASNRAMLIWAMLLRLNAKWFPPEARQHAPQPLLELDFRLPAQQLPGSRDVGLANLWIVDWKCFEHDFAL